MKFYCITGVNIIISAFAGDPTDMLKHIFVLITRMMMDNRFPLPLNKYMAKLCHFFDCFPKQLSTQIFLVYKRAKMLETASTLNFSCFPYLELLAKGDTTRWYKVYG